MTNITLYAYKGENDVLRKKLNSLDATKKVTLSGTIKEGTSITHPSIDITYGDIFTKKWTMCYIDSYLRYYFITDVITLNNNRYRLVLEEDVLTSFESGILDLEAFIERNEYTYNPSVEDKKIRFESESRITEVTFNKNNPLGPGIEKINWTKLETNKTPSGYSWNIVLSTFTNKFADSSADQQINNSDIAQNVGGRLPWIRPYDFNIGTNMLYVMDRAKLDYHISELYRLENLLGIQDKLSTFILGCVAYPFDVPDVGDQTHLWLNDRDLTEDTAYIVNKLRRRNSQYILLARFNFNDEIGYEYDKDFLYREPYSKYELFIPYVGTIELQANLCMGKTISVYMSISYVDGMATVYVADTYGYVLYTNSIQIGIRLNINTTNALENRKALENANTVAATSAVSGAITAFVGLGLAATGVGVGAGVGMMAAGTLGMMKAGTDLETTKNSITERASVSMPTTVTGLYMSQDVILRRIYLEPTSYGEDFNKLYGRVLLQERELFTLRGYTIVNAVHVENIEGATKTEKEMIYNKLISGVIIKPE